MQQSLYVSKKNSPSVKDLIDINTQFHFKCDIPEERRQFLRELKTDGVEQVRFYIRESRFTDQQKQVATQWIADYVNGLTHEADLRYIIDELKNIEDKFFQQGDIKRLSDSLSGRAKGLYTEAEQIASLGVVCREVATVFH